MHLPGWIPALAGMTDELRRLMRLAFHHKLFNRYFVAGDGLCTDKAESRLFKKRLGGAARFGMQIVDAA